MTEVVDTDDILNGNVSTSRCNETTTTTATVIPTQTTMNNVLNTSKQTSTSGKTTRRNMNKPKGTTKNLVTTTTATTSETCAKTLGKHNFYLKDNLDIVRQKCSEFHACTVELYKSENLHRILAGDNIQLRNICGLLYQSTNGGYRVLDNQCSAQERESIKELLGDEELSSFLEGSSPGEGSWGKLKTCLDNTQGDNTYLDKLCRLKGNSTLPLCNATEVQSETENFFNTKLRHHHCVCDTVTDLSAPPLALIGGLCGGALAFLLVVIIIVLCVRQRKLKRRLSTVSKCSDNKMSPTDETSFVDQGIRDHSKTCNLTCQVPDTRRNPPANQPPRLPERYVPYQLPETTSHSDYDVLPDVACVLPEDRGSGTFGDQRSPQDNPERVAPSSDRKTRLSVRHEGPAGMEMKSDGGYTPLGLTPTLMVRRPSADSEEGGSHNSSRNPSYFELELS
ncbi:uncharacterized protein LOC112574827 [Pomacea canaliculata]|uniref:uncharacterized protein LOC112574827 n=1 Tax=Pomacea canaliculata TaxID=400727 RepID=UPI000D733FC3|nr:uncharacterized protein LOC112574827 [Pomacea canaliculata]